MFKKFEVRPVVVSDVGEVTPFVLHAEAHAFAKENDQDLVFALYGLDEDGLWQHITDSISKEFMVEIVRKLFGIDLSWPHKDRIEIEQSETVAAKVISELLSVLHPGAVGLIANHHGKESYERALSAVYSARAFLHS